MGEEAGIRGCSLPAEQRAQKASAIGNINHLQLSTGKIP